MTTAERAAELNSKVAKRQRGYNLTRQDYITSGVPTDHELVVTDEDIVAYKYNSPHGKNYPALMAFVGKANKPVIYNSYFTVELRDEALENLNANIKSRREFKEKQKAERSKPHTVKVGDIFEDSWGYDQTNVDFYQVTKLIGKTMVEIRKIGKKVVDTPHCTYQNVVAHKDAFLPEDSFRGGAMKKKVSMSYGSPSIRIASYSSASLWDGTPQYETALGFGH